MSSVGIALLLGSMAIGFVFSGAIWCTLILRRAGGGIEPRIAFAIWFFSSLGVASTIALARVLTLAGLGAAG